MKVLILITGLDMDGTERQVYDQLDAIAAKGGLALRERSRVSLGLEVAESQYRRVYRELEQTC